MCSDMEKQEMSAFREISNHKHGCPSFLDALILVADRGHPSTTTIMSPDESDITEGMLG